MKYYTTKNTFPLKFFVWVILSILALILLAFYVYLNNYRSSPKSVSSSNIEYEYVPNETDSDATLLEPLSSETSFPGGIPSFLQNTRHDPEVQNIQDNIDIPEPQKKK